MRGIGRHIREIIRVEAEKREPFYFHSQHRASQRHPEWAPPRVRKSPTQAVPLGTDGHWTEPTGAGRGGELRASVQPRAQDGAWHTGNDGLQAQS